LLFQKTFAEVTPGRTPQVFRSVIEGTAGPVRDAVLLNAAAGIAAHAAASGSLAERLGSGWSERSGRSTRVQQPTCWRGGWR
jgi:anthranilate phosphoribosyltransferase